MNVIEPSSKNLSFLIKMLKKILLHVWFQTLVFSFVAGQLFVLRTSLSKLCMLEGRLSIFRHS